MAQEDTDFLAQMFSAGGAGGGKAGGAAEAPAAAVAVSAALVTTLDFKRANNLNISLAQFRKFPSTQLFSAVYRLDGVALPRESLEKLTFVLPTPDEIKLVKAYKGAKSSLMECDRFFLAIADVPRFGSKVAAFASTLTVAQAARDAEAKVLLLTGACASLMDSTRLQSILACVLHMGNILNAGTKLEGAAGVSLDSLSKLQATKAADKKTTMMDALVMLSEKKFGADILTWPDDLKDTTAAARVELPELKGELSRLRAAIMAASKEADAEDVDVNKDEAAMAAFAAELDTPEVITVAPVVTVAVVVVAAPEAVENDPRKAMLAQMMKKRGGDGAPTPAAVAAGEPIKPKVKIVLSTNPCTIADRRAFVTGIRAKVLAVSASIASLETLIGVAERAASDLAEYFGEEPRLTPPSRVFSSLKGFAANFVVAAAVAAKKKVAEEKEKVKTAAASEVKAVMPPPPPPGQGSKMGLASASVTASASAQPVRATLGAAASTSAAVAAPPPVPGGKMAAPAPVSASAQAQAQASSGKLNKRAGIKATVARMNMRVSDFNAKC